MNKTNIYSTSTIFFQNNFSLITSPGRSINGISSNSQNHSNLNNMKHTYAFQNGNSRQLAVVVLKPTCFAIASRFFTGIISTFFSGKSTLFALLLGFLLFASSEKSMGQTPVFSDDFSTNTSATFTSSGAIGASAWSVVATSDFGARRNISPEQLELTNDATGGANANGWVFCSTPTSSFSSPYNTTLASNTGLLTWTLNMRQIRSDPAGLGSGAYGVAFVLAGTSTTTQTVGTGYALALGQSGGTDPLRLIKYSAGLATSSNLITSNTSGLTDFGVNSLSVKVTYDPATDMWELFLRSDGASFVDPLTGTLVSQGSISDATYTTSSLTSMGAFWTGSTAGSQTSFFDNVTVSITALAPSISSPTAVSITSSSATLGGDVTGDGGSAITASGVVWSETTINANPTIGGTGCTDVTGPGTLGVFSVNASGMPSNTQISYSAYATNAIGTSYTTATTFNTLVSGLLTPPTLTAAVATDFTLRQLVLSLEVSSQRVPVTSLSADTRSSLA